MGSGEKGAHFPFSIFSYLNAAMSSVSRSLAGVVLNFEAGLNLNLAPVPEGEGVMVGELDRTTEVEPFLESRQCHYQKLFRGDDLTEGTFNLSGPPNI